MTPITITLPIPDRAVSPNAQRGQSKWAAIKKSKIVKAHRFRALVLVHNKLLNIRPIPAPSEWAGYSLAFFFKTAAFRDDDNADASCKAYRDGIADSLGINDKGFRKLKLSTHAKDAKNPRVEITIYPKETP